MDKSFAGNGYVLRGPNRKIQVTISDRLYHLLVTHAIRMGQSQAEVVRRALWAYLMKDALAAAKGFELSLVVQKLPRILRRIHPRLED